MIEATSKFVTGDGDQAHMKAKLGEWGAIKRDELAAGLEVIWQALCERAENGKHLASKSELAEALGISKQAISQWRCVPHLRVLQIEALLDVPRYVQRPDIYPPPPCLSLLDRQYSSDCT